MKHVSTGCTTQYPMYICIYIHIYVYINSGEHIAEIDCYEGERNWQKSQPLLGSIFNNLKLVKICFQLAG